VGEGLAVIDDWFVDAGGGRVYLVLFFTSGPDPEPLEYTCLHQIEMNYYLSGIRSIAQMFRPADKGIISYQCNSTISTGIGTWAWWHYATIRYGIFHQVIDPPSQL